MVREMASAYGLGKAMGQGWHDMDAAIHERDVSSRMNDIMQATNAAGGDITMIDPKFSSDRVGLEAMGRVAKQLSNTEEYKTRIMRNNIEQAHHLYGVVTQYEKDIDSKIGSGDLAGTYSLMGAMMQQLGTPYTLFQADDGKMHWGYKGRDGVQDMGEADAVQLFKELKNYVRNKGSFMKAFVMHRQAAQQQNVDNWNDLSKWKTVYDKNGTPFTAIEMNVWDGDSYEPGFMVQTPNGLVEMSAQQLLASGLSPNKAAGGLGAGGNGALPKSLEMYAMDYAIDADGKQQKFVNPYKYDVISKAVAFGQDPAQVMATWDQRMAEVLKAAPNMPREQASIVVYQNFMKAAGGAPTPAPTKTPDKLDQSIAQNEGRGGVPDSQPDKQETTPPGTTRPERVNGQWMDVTRNEKGEVVDMQPPKKSGKGKGSFGDWRKGVSASLKESEEDYRKRGGPGLRLSSDYLHR